MLAMTGTLLEWTGGPCRSLYDFAPEVPADYASWLGHELEVDLVGQGQRRVSLRIGRGFGLYVGIFADLGERDRLLQELRSNRDTLEEKVLELSRSQRAILNILEDLEERSRELTGRKGELEVLNLELQRFNRELERANRDLRGLDELKSNLLSNISHELRTPLVAIKGYSELMLRGKLGPLSPKQREGLEISMKSQDRLLDLINNLLDFSRIEAGRLQLRPSSFDIDTVVNEVIASVTPRARERNLKLRFDLPEAGTRFTGDRGKLAQILTNLLTNAIKFNRDEGTVELEIRRLPAELLIRISDTGIGIAPEDVANIFDRFFQIDSSMTRRFGGTGIGLSIVKSLVELHGGSIQVASTVDQGTTFHVRIPELEVLPEQGIVGHGRHVLES